MLNDEGVAHGSQEKGLIGLGLKRAREIGVEIAYNSEKQQFFCDGSAFKRYLSETPRGGRAAEAAFWLVENEFYQSSPEALVAASENKKAFLRRYPKFAADDDVNVFLAIDYRDLYQQVAIRLTQVPTMAWGRAGLIRPPSSGTEPVLWPRLVRQDGRRAGHGNERRGG